MNYCCNRPQGIPFFMSILNGRPTSLTHVRGSEGYPKLRGTVRFYQTKYGTLVAAEIFGLPKKTEECHDQIFAFHIHEGHECAGDCTDPFADSMSHYNPQGCEHPYHAGDLPPLFGNNGYAFSVFLTDRFCAREIAGRTLIIHRNPDDFTTQPSGNAGEKIACGVIQPA